MKILEEGRNERIGRKGSQESDIFIHEGKDKRTAKFKKEIKEASTEGGT